MASGTFANADFRDITFSSASNLDLSAITGLSGDCGGNTITGGGTVLTFTTPATQTATGSSANWSAATWTSRVPLPQDNVVISLTAGQTLTNDMSRLGKSISFGTATAFTMTLSASSFGSVDFTGSGAYGGSGTWSFESLARAGTITVTSAGKIQTAPWIFSAFGTTVQALDAISTNQSITQFDGSFTTNFNVTAFGYSSGAAAIDVSMGSGTWTLSRTGAPWATFGGTVTAGTSTIFLTDVSVSTKNFTGSGKTYYDLKVAGGGTGAIIITSANTFNRIYTDGGGTKSITLPGSTTTTLLSGNGLSNGTNVITFTASAGSATVAKSGGGTVSWNYVNLTNIIASTANTWYAGANSTDGGGNTNWIFTFPPSRSGTSNVLYSSGPPLSSIGVF